VCAGRDDYRIKAELLEKDLTELQQKVWHLLLACCFGHIGTLTCLFGLSVSHSLTTNPSRGQLHLASGV